jgi:hypothetical protein
MKAFTTKNLIKLTRKFSKNQLKFNLTREEILKRLLTHPDNEVVTQDLKTISDSVKSPYQLLELTQEVTRISSKLSLEGHEVGYNFKKTPVRVAVTGAAGNISYSLLFRIARYKF